ncbi:DNA ligase [Fusobacterium sp. DD29]|uniref:NAD-dependent DNA ligase LigA n=1 Tax=unclassified Fusobacterium TaxID=2648384 RepID=UPI001B8B7668|nr:MULTISPECIES: NAD-dependent DNA ligase LigA [unclassified Fusobacterium]MBR8748519.1 DNA ligase [Fusobacterium sp. DD29]MBR8760786.1 DNA ligase [Fusobacterium sp. DD25]MBR8766798.1 DNA ligase [Fusobacterium sp. DD43]MBR8770799.1 DNA ligase [Fusobacterium sp. DD40]MBR8775016.1 DNA ligase [Fusobacterium sp. DD17]
MDVKKKIEEMREKIKMYSDYYYTNNSSLISDVEFDKMLAQLKKLEEEYPQYADSQSPTQVVGATDLKSTKFQKVTHKRPMLSLSNTYNEGEIKDFTTRVKKLLPQDTKVEYALELKLDGLSISVQYEKGKLVKAVTRGDGQIGEDVTENIIQIESLPKTLKEEVDMEIRGEVVLPISRFEALNEKRLENGEDVFANPRNAASGTLRQLDSSIIKERGLDAYFYFLIDAGKMGFKSHSESLAYLSSLGIKTTGICEVCKTASELMKRIDYWGEKREELDYETDGMVIKVDNIELWDELGTTTKSPRWAIAFKFPAKQVTTKITGVTWQVGRTGKITPVAELDEVELSGSRVKRASLHNFQEIERKSIKIGDTVFIEKAAEIIPQVITSVKELRDGSETEIIEPTHCPICNTKVVRQEGQVDIKCPNPQCPGKIEGELIYFVSRDAMNIAGFGSKIVENMLKLGFVKNIVDIYSLKEHREELEKLEKMGKRSVDKLLIAIEDSKKREYSKVLCALGIPYVGKTSAKLLAKETKNIDRLMAMSVEELMGIEGIGDKMAQAIYDFVRDEEKISLINSLREHGLQFAEEETAEENTEEQIFIGKTFLFTGTLKNFKRDEIKEAIEKLGGKNLSAVSRNLDYLIVGEKAGSKLKKAQDLGTVKIITEDEFIDMCNKK